MIEAIIVFSAVFALDFVWVRYTLAMTSRAAFRAGGFASLIIILSGAAQIGYTANPWLLVPAALGAFAGTYLATK